MGNFTEDLAKGFVRSAVNQVGRDGGKVISNSIYGNAHSTPIRGIGKNTHNQFFDESTNEVISPEELRLRAESEGFQVSLFRYNAGIKIVLYIVSLNNPSNNTAEYKSMQGGWQFYISGMKAHSSCASKGELKKMLKSLKGK